MGPLLSCETAEAAILLQFQAAIVFGGDVTSDGVPERNKRREGQWNWRKRCASEVLVGQILPMGYNKISMGCGRINPTAR
jgi:hypothetical protein